MPLFHPKVDSDVVKMLEKVPIFASLTERQLRSLAKDTYGRVYKEGESVVKQGEKGIGFFLILDGGVEVRKDGRRVASLSTGDFFGEMALFREQPRTADVVAVRPTRCLVLSRWEFWGFAADNARLLRGMMEVIVRRLGDTSKALSE